MPKQIEPKILRLANQTAPPVSATTLDVSGGCVQRIRRVFAPTHVQCLTVMIITVSFVHTKKMMRRGVKFFLKRLQCWNKNY